MSEESAGSKRAANEVELLSIIQFQDELRRAGRFCPRPPITGALVAVVHKIQQNPAYTQSRLLTRLLAALTYQRANSGARKPLPSTSTLSPSPSL